MRLLSVLLLLLAVPAVAGEIPADPAAVCPILPGETIPPGLTARTAGGEEIDVTGLLAEPTVLVVYRGGWCPYCSRHLADLQAIEAELIALGYQLVALSPDRPGKAAEVATSLVDSRFRVLSDSPMELCAQLGIAFEVDPELVDQYREWGIGLEADSGYDHHRLPVPAAFVITDSTVRFSYVNPDYKSRVEGSVLLAAAAAAIEGQTGR